MGFKEQRLTKAKNMIDSALNKEDWKFRSVEITEQAWGDIEGGDREEGVNATVVVKLYKHGEK